ncbi:MAG: glycosyltransferase [Nitrospiraceae bacterium]|nr:glycosyltransferase [Nitrospiraceae bacterium]
MISGYEGTSPERDLEFLKVLGEKLSGRSVLNVNSTKSGGGVAELLNRIVPMLGELGLDARWEVIRGDADFFDMTKKLHNSLQGNREHITYEMWEHYYQVNRRNAERLDLKADFVFVHDPQPLPLIKNPKREGTWIWRCHIDMSSPQKNALRRVSTLSRLYDAAVFSVAGFAMQMPMPEYIVLPSIDPLSEKNRELSAEEIFAVAARFGIPQDRPVLLQVSRFDRFKDPIGVIKTYRLVKKYNDCILVLAGSPATDDPEGARVLEEVKEFAKGDPDIKILLLPPFSDKEINALQRMAAIVFQKSLREGFGLTVSEAMWKGKPVIGGAVGGIPYQIINGMTGFLIYSVEGAAFRARQLLNNEDMLRRMGEQAMEHVRNNFLITRQLRDYLSVLVSLENREKTLIELV